jgi:N6-L-threonylcarbamoyladenine synthase
MLVLGIESTCDETACAIVKDGKEILAHVVSSQIDLHNEFGGVVPELACRRHVEVMIPILQETLSQAHLTLQEIDLIAVATTPGLIGALLIGLNTAKALSLVLNRPFIGVNHVEAHLYAACMTHSSLSFPSLGVILSGGHTALVHVKGYCDYELIGQTVDDAIGEAFDKVAKLLGLPYPGGPQIERLALQGDPKRYPLKAGNVKGRPFHFSFSGLKTAVLYTVKGQNKDLASSSFSEKDMFDLAASFQSAAFQDIIDKTKRAAEKWGCHSILFGGGVTANQALRKSFESQLQAYRLYWPPTHLSLDNAAMIAGLGYHQFLKRGEGDSLALEASPQSQF